MITAVSSSLLKPWNMEVLTERRVLQSRAAADAALTKQYARESGGDGAGGMVRRIKEYEVRGMRAWRQEVQGEDIRKLEVPGDREVQGTGVREEREGGC